MRETTPALAPKLSVTVLNYNYGHFLANCIQSILSQSYTHFELIVIDDCSEDDSIEVNDSVSFDLRSDGSGTALWLQRPASGVPGIVWAATVK